MNPNVIFDILLLLLCATASFTDFRTGLIPNWLTLPSLALGVALHLGLFGTYGLLSAVGGIALCGLVPYLLFLREAMGGGDVKLLAAVGALAGHRLGIEIELWTFLVAALYAMSVLTWKGKLWQTLLNCFHMLTNPFRPKQSRIEIKPELMSTIRFGIPVFITVLIIESLRWSA